MVACEDEHGDLVDGDLCCPVLGKDGKEELYVGIITNDTADEYEVSPLGVYLCAIETSQLGKFLKPIAKFTSEHEALDFISLMQTTFGAKIPTESD